MKKKRLIAALTSCLVLSACLGLSSCGNGKDHGGDSQESADLEVSFDSGAEADSEQGSDGKEECPAGTVPVWLLAESYVYIGDEFWDHYVCERNQYGNVLTRKKCGEDNYDVISVDYRADVKEEEGAYYIDTPYKGQGISYRFAIDENGNVTAISGKDWTLTYSDDDPSVFKITSVNKGNTTSTTVRKYDDKYRCVEYEFYSGSISEPKVVRYYAYDDRDRCVWMREINYERNYDFENTISSFCEMDRPLVSFYVESSRKDGVQQMMTEYTCECTYDGAGNVITEIHRFKENDKIDFTYAYAYDDVGNMIEMKEIEDDGYIRDIYEYDADGNQIGYRLSEGKSHDIYRPFPVQDDALVLAFLTLKAEKY